MKKILNITIAAFALMTFAGSAFGQAVIHIAGSTAYRPSVNAAIMDIFTPGTVFCAYDSSSTTYKSSPAIYYGQLASLGAGHNVYIKTYWTGSLAGVFDLSNQTGITHWVATPSAPPPNPGGQIPGTAVFMVAASHDATGGTPNTGTNIHGLTYTTETAPPDCAMSDAAATSVIPVLKGAHNGSTFANVVSNNTLTDNGTGLTTVGTVNFVWTAGHQVAALPYSNMTQQAAAELVQAGGLPYGQLAGSSDTTNYAFIVSRNEDSGTRIDGNAESQSGFNPVLNTWQFTFTGSTTTENDNGNVINTGGAPAASVTGGIQWPTNWNLNTVPTCFWSTAAHSGYLGGGDVANVLKATGDNVSSFGGFGPGFFQDGISHAALIGALSTADQGGSVGTTLTYNGVPYSVTNVQNGSYTLWGFEHCYRRHTAPVLTGDALQAVNDLANKLAATDAPSNGNGKTDNSGATPDVAGTLYDTNCKYGKVGSEGSYEVPNGN